MKNLDLIGKIIVMSLIAGIISSCQGIFVRDPIEPELPKYTQEGHNVAGAFIGKDIWRSVVRFNIFNVSTDFAPSIVSFPKGDSIIVVFSGEVNSTGYNIEFHLSGLKITKLEDLVKLEDKKIQLNGVSNSGYFHKNFEDTWYGNKGTGQIYFKNVSKADSIQRYTISGTFGFSLKYPVDGYTKISYGRFDYNFSDSEFRIE